MIGTNRICPCWRIWWDEEDEEDEENKSKDAEAEEKAKETDRKATHEDVKEYIRAIRYDMSDYWGDVPAATAAFHNELVKMLDWDADDLPNMSEIWERMGHGQGLERQGVTLVANFEEIGNYCM